ncbi:MAG: hypothetical protein Q4E10_00870 [Porphyromonas sp.]|nr:hypothetical protein [Porphyromonas sp.]
MAIVIGIGSLPAIPTVSAQGVESTPLTRLGYGALTNNSPVAWRAMGGVGIAMSNPHVINLQNPAAYGATDSLSFLMDIGASVIFGHYKDDAGSKNAIMGGLDYLSLQFPLYKNRLALSAGVVPFSNVGYSLISDKTIEGRETANMIRQTFEGKGSLQSFYLGLGARIYGGLYAGANVKYHFGRLTHTVHLQPNALTLSQDFQTYGIRLDNWGVDFGLQYKVELPTQQKDKITFGVTYAPKMRFTPELTNFVNSNYGANNLPIIKSDTLRVNSNTPHKIGAGMAWEMPKKVTLSADIETELWGDKGINNPFANDGAKMINSYRGALGVEVTPDSYARSYHKRMYYRGGVNYRTSYLDIPGIGSLQTIGASVGLGMPVNMFGSDRNSIINLTLEYQHGFSTVEKGFSQDQLKLSLSLNFNETWFRKLKIY